MTLGVPCSAGGFSTAGCSVRSWWRHGVLLAVGVVPVYSGACFDAWFLPAEGILDVCLALWLPPALCWYTIDPLGLHWKMEDGVGS